VPGADRGAEREADDHREHPGDVVLGHQDRGHRAGERGDGPDRQVDVPRDDDDHHADRQDQDRGVLGEQVGEVQGPQQDAVGGDLEEHHDGHQRDDHAVLADVAPQQVLHTVHRTTSCSRLVVVM
jgi:hypothetical protein